MKSNRREFILAFCGMISLVGPLLAAERPYYQGKNITFLINYAAGGPTDIEGRIVARHLAKYIPGNPAVVVQNMPGAGGVEPQMVKTGTRFDVGEEGERLRERVLRAPKEIIDFVRQYVEQARK